MHPRFPRPERYAFHHVTPLRRESMTADEEMLLILYLEALVEIEILRHRQGLAPSSPPE